MIPFNELQDAEVYVGTWAKYNEGNLYGKWMKLSDFNNHEEFVKACRELHKDEEDPEFDIQDYQYIDGYLTDSLFHSDLYWDMLEVINDNPHVDWDMIAVWCDLKSVEIETADDLEDAISDAEEHYRGKFDSDEEFAEQEMEEMFPQDLPSWIRNNIDWEGVARDLMYDYSEQDGYYFFDY